MNWESRFTQDFELRADDKGFTGYAARFYSAADEQGTTYRLSPNLVERVSRTAFERTIRDGHDIKIYGQHDQAQPLGRTNTTKTCQLRLWTDDRGLGFSLPYDGKDPDHRKYAAKLRNGSVCGMSFRFYAQPHKGDRFLNERGIDYRELVDVELDEVSLVTNPAYRAANCTMRSDGQDANWQMYYQLWQDTNVRMAQAEIILGRDGYIPTTEPTNKPQCK